MCVQCGKTVGCEYTFETAKESVDLCPNHVVGTLVENGTLGINVADCRFESEISGQPAVKIFNALDPDDVYFVTPDEADRLMGYALLPNEFLTLAKKHSTSAYLLHEDFYQENTGIAYQPVDDKKYLAELDKYSDTLPDKNEQKNIKRYIADVQFLDEYYR